jgi:hypothetical protein
MSEPMSTEHKPESPLPWTVNMLLESDLKMHCVGIRDAKKGVVLSSERQENVEYIAHACNAYPNIIEVLKGLKINPLDGSVAGFPIFELLRELGELGGKE